MKTVDRIWNEMKALPEPAQQAVLDFVEFLKHKIIQQDDAGWSDISLASALRGLESDVWPEYVEESLKERWQ